VQADASLDVEAVRATRRRAMRIDAARALALVEHGTHDVTRQAPLALGFGEIGDARIDLGAHLGREAVETFAEQLPLGANELRDVREAMTAGVAAATARPPRALLGRRARASIDVVVEGEEPGSHESGFVRRARSAEDRVARARGVHEDESMASLVARGRVALAPVALVGLMAVAASCSSVAESGPIGGADPKANAGETGSSGGSTSGKPEGPGALVDGGPSGAGDASGALKTNGFPAKWIDGTACGTDPAIQTWNYAEGTFILRQSLCTTFEGPFMYLLVGATKALLVDTGTGGVDLRAEVLKLLAGKNVQLVVAHSHSHGDHVSGDNAFRDRRAPPWWASSRAR
jgi:hypothetical protein